MRAAFEFVLAAARRGRSAGSTPGAAQPARSPLAEHHPAGGGRDRAHLLAAARAPGDEVEIEVDLSLARGLRYYTGLVFEIYVESPDGPVQVVGGGRYDDLIRALGGRESVPACGFSYGLERVELVRPAPTQAPARRRRALVVPIDADDCGEAFRIADELRTTGLVVEQDVRLRGPKAALRHADRTGVDLVAFVGAQERAEGVVVLRDMQARSERRVTRAELVAAVSE